MQSHRLIKRCGRGNYVKLQLFAHGKQGTMTFVKLKAAILNSSELKGKSVVMQYRRGTSKVENMSSTESQANIVPCKSISPDSVLWRIAFFCFCDTYTSFKHLQGKVFS